MQKRGRDRLSSGVYARALKQGDKMTEKLIGLFINILVLRSQPRGADSFGDYLQRLHETALAAFTHQDLPLERLIGELQP